MTIKDHGSCYCGNIKFNIWDFEPQYTVCHCSQCSRWTGSQYASITVKDGNYNIEGQEHITWHKQGPLAERGFCKQCGSNIFWRLLARNIAKNQFLDFAIAMLNNPDQLTPNKHIHCHSKLSFYQLPNDSAPKYNNGLDQ